MRKKNELTHHLDIFGVALLLLVISELPPVTIAVRVPLQKFGVCFTRCLCVVLKNTSMYCICAGGGGGGGIHLVTL